MFLITLEQVGVFFAYIFLGYFLTRAKVISRAVSKDLSKLLTTIFLPAYVILSLIDKCSIENISTYIVLVIAGAVFMVVGTLICKPVSKLFGNTKIERNCYYYMIMIGNFGYLGYPLVEGVFGAEALTQFVLFCLPISLFVHSYAYVMLTETEASISGESKFNWKSLVSPPIVAVVLGLGIGLLGVKLPIFVINLIAPAKGCMSACAMILAGIVLASYSPKQLFSSPKAYLTGVITLLVLPLVFGGLSYAICALTGLSKEVFIMVTSFCCLPAGMNVVVFPESAGHDSSVGARTCFCSYAMAIVTLPLVFTVIEVLAKTL